LYQEVTTGYHIVEFILSFILRRKLIEFESQQDV